MTDKEDNKEELEELIYEGRISGVFHGFRNHDSIFKFSGGSAWRQIEYLFEYHHLYSPKARILKLIDKVTRRERFFIEVDGVTTRAEVKSSYA